MLEPVGKCLITAVVNNLLYILPWGNLFVSSCKTTTVLENFSSHSV